MAPTDSCPTPPIANDQDIFHSSHQQLRNQGVVLIFSLSSGVGLEKYRSDGIVGVDVAFFAALAKPAEEAVLADPLPQTTETVFIERVDGVLSQRSLGDTHHRDVVGTVGIVVVPPAGRWNHHLLPGMVDFVALVIEVRLIRRGFTVVSGW